MAKVTLVTDQISTVSDLTRVVHRSKNTRRLLFRGQNVDAPLLPKLVRIAETSSITSEQFNKAERRMLERFQKESMPFFRGSRSPANPWEWLSVAQHQGLPTRLLDWTANALAGLWFAVSADPPTGGADGVLWVLDVSEENERSPTGAEDIFNLKRTFVFQPFHIDGRIVSQAAWFSVHRYSSTGKFVPLERLTSFKSALRKYTIPGSRFGTIRRDLRLMGITQASMFPDLSGLCADIQAECLDSWRGLGTI